MPLGEISILIGEKNYGDNPITDTMFNFTDFRTSNKVDEYIVEDTNKFAIESNIKTNTIFDFNIDITFGYVDIKIDSSIFNESIIVGFFEYFKNTIQLLVVDRKRKLNESNLSYGLLEAKNEAQEIDFIF
ncbi:hypothetical protein [Paenibacillus gorillae]|uniref:hypothetical protein n=1 Tax=Paenibacillus gorillae TaxID=1243662 RepID=UPI0005A7D8C6|nr:hypothetical protein [Paenibacillus gorillae]